MMPADTAASSSPPVSDDALLVILEGEALRHRLPVPAHIRRRLASTYQSTASAEILECVLADGAEWPVLWKHAVRRQGDPLDTRSGLAYEAQVYARILAADGHGQPRFLGAVHDAATGEDWLFEEFIPAGVRLSEFPLDVAGSAAGWLGQFHRDFERSPIVATGSFLRRYDETWYRGWVDRTRQLIERAGRRTPELDTLIEDCRERLPRLLEAPLTLIHGEFYPDNVIIDGTAVRPVDWESAAVAVGEIDLATLTEGWPAADEAVLVDRYRATRWAGTPPDAFEERYQAARAYSACRRLADEEGWTPEADRYLEQLIDAAGRLGVATPNGSPA